MPSTLGEALDAAFDNISTTLNNMSSELNLLKARLQALEAAQVEIPVPAEPPPEELVPAPSDPVDTDPVYSARRLSEMTISSDGTYYISDSSGFVLFCDVIGAAVSISRCADFAVRGRDLIRTLELNDCSRFELSELRSISMGSMFVLRRCNSGAIEDCSCNISRYFLWCEHSRNISVFRCTAYTTGEESCIRFVSCTVCTVESCMLSSDLKHCFRIHGENSEICLLDSTIRGGNGIMIGTMPGDSLEDITFEDVRSTTTGPDALNLSQNGNMRDVILRNCEFEVTGWDPIESYKANLPSGVTFDNVSSRVL